MATRLHTTLRALSAVALIALPLGSCMPLQVRQAMATAPKTSLNEPPSEGVLATADYGNAPGSDHQDQVRAGLQALLKDPESARYQFAVPETGWLPRYLFDKRVDGQPYQHGQVFGWILRFSVNAKNSFGGYAGPEAYEAFFQEGRLRGLLQRSPYEDAFGFPNWFLVRAFTASKWSQQPCLRAVGSGAPSPSDNHIAFSSRRSSRSVSRSISKSSRARLR